MPEPPSTFTALRALLRRDFRLLWRRRGDALNPVLFALLVISLFPFALGPEPTTLARIDWIHWIESAKQAKTRKSRVENACQMLASGKKRVCCFDPSGFYSKALAAPLASE